MQCKSSKCPVCLTEKFARKSPLADSQKISRALISTEIKLTKNRRDRRMSRGGDRERKRWGWLRDGEGRKGGIKGKGGMETSKKFQTWKVPTSAQFIPFPPRGQQEPECEAGLQPAVSCSQCSPAPGEERKSLLMLRDA